MGSMFLVWFFALGLIAMGMSVLLNFLLSHRLQRQGFEPLSKPPWLDPHYRFDGARSVSFRGGSRVGWYRRASIPLIDLRFDQRWAHLSGTGVLRMFGGPGPVWIDRSVIARVHRIGTRGVRFEATDGRYDGVIFWTLHHEQVLAALHHYGWPVS